MWSFSVRAKGKAIVLLGCIRAEAESLLPRLSELLCFGTPAHTLWYLCQRLSRRRHSSTSGSSGQDPRGTLDTSPSFEPAVLVLLILASSQPSSTSENQKAVPGPRADPEWCRAPQACWAAGSWLCWDTTWLYVPAKQQKLFFWFPPPLWCLMSFNALCQPVLKVLVLVGVCSP